MSAPVLVGFAGVLVAAVATGMLAGRCARQPRTGFIAWAVATLGLTIALAAESMGFVSGFGPVTFRAVQVLALLLAPLWLAWGLVEAVVPSDAARFGMRLISAALTVVATVILATDPLAGPPFSKAWPLTAEHLQPVAVYALDAVQAVAVLALVASVAVAVARRPGPPPQAVRAAAPLVAVVSVGLAVLMNAGQRFALPAKAAYPLLGMAAAALVWFGVSRFGELPAGAAGRAGSRRGLQDVQDDRDRPGDDAWPGRGPGGYGPDGQYAAYGHRGGRPVPAGRAPGGFPGTRPVPGGGPAPGGGPVQGEGRSQHPVDDRARRPGPPGAARARPYGRILIFTLLDDRIAEFDRLAEEAAEQVRTGEPDTLVYVIHLVPNAPLQRIFYEIYRDRTAFDSHESQPYMQRFVTERRSCVLATNVIELRLKYAKVAPLPGPPTGRPPRYDERYDPRHVPSGGPYSG